jgi:hypothetical protein
MAGSSMIGNLAVNLSMNTAAFQAGASKAEHRAKSMQGRFNALGGTFKSMAAGFAGGIVAGMIPAASSMISSAFELAASLKEASEKMGVTVEGLQRLRVAARETGVSNEQLDAAMVRLNKSLGELQFGSKAATAAFERIGLTADDLRGKRPDEALRLIADALNKIPDPQQRIAAGSAIMGRNFAQLIPMISGGSEALEKYAQQSKASGEVSDENARKLDELSDRWAGFKVGLGVATANIIANVAGMYDKVNGFLKGLGDAAHSFDAAVLNMATNAVRSVTNMVSGISAAITGKLNAIWEGAKAKIESVKQKFADMYDAVVGNSYVPDMVDGIAQSMMQLGRVLVDPAVSATDKVAAVFQNLQGVLGDIFGRKAGGIIGIIGQFATALAPLIFGKGAPGAIWETGATGGAIGMASGGSGVFGGRSGVDRNLLSLNGSPIARVSRGEHFAVSPANDRAPRNVTIQQTFQFEGVAVTKTEFMQGLMMTKSATIGAIRDMDRRR